MVILNGLLFGLVLAVLIGPVFFTLIQTSLEKGFNKAVLVAVGIVLSDLSYIMLAYFGVSKFLKKSGYDEDIAYAGGIILLLFGVFSFYRATQRVDIPETAVDTKGFFRFIFKGFLINGISPFVLLFWVGAMSLATVEYHYEDGSLVAFFSIILGVVFSTDLLKAHLAGKLRPLLTPRLFTILNIVVGVALCLFGIRMFSFSL